MDIVIFSGTTEGRRLSDYLSSHHVEHDVCVATESGEAVMVPGNYARVHVGRLDEEGIRHFFDEKNPSAVIDATHPYAQVVTDLLKRVCDERHLPFYRVNRESCQTQNHGAAFRSYKSAEECAKALCKESGNVFLSTGSKELSCYMQYPELRDRIYVRVLPTMEALTLCREAGINEKHIIAMYGPHTREVNEALFCQYGIRHLVTKESGQTGGYQEKLKAAEAIGAAVHVIERPENATGISMKECVQVINKICGIEGNLMPEISIKLAGLGPGNSGSMTEDVKQAIEEADYIFGAKRMLDSVNGQGVKIPCYLPKDIIARLEEMLLESSRECIRVAALFSGDTGCYSGATKLYGELKKWGKCDNLRLLPGISSFAAFAAQTGVEYQDAHLKSLHGKSADENNLRKIRDFIAKEEKTFLLMSGKSDFAILEKLLPEHFTGEIVIGRNLSYPDQKIIYTTGKELQEVVAMVPEGLFIVLIHAGCER